MSLLDGIVFQAVRIGEAARHVDELSAVYREVYAEPPYEWGAEHEELFVERFASQRVAHGFRLVEARSDDQLIAFGFGFTVPPTTVGQQNLITPVSDGTARELSGRKFALVELLVRKPWRRKHVAETIHDRLMHHRREERATLTVLPAATAAQAAYAKWGWHKVAQKHNPLPGSPIFDVLVKKLRAPA